VILPPRFKRSVNFVDITSEAFRRFRRPHGTLVLQLFELARVLVRFDHIASFIVNANHSII
jgi:hypothetical protein